MSAIIIVELVGGVTLARQMVRKALRAGKLVVQRTRLSFLNTAKSFRAGPQTSHQFVLRGQCRGGIPIIKVLREGLVGNRINYLYGISTELAITF